MSMAIQYAMQKRRKMAEGGEMGVHDQAQGYRRGKSKAGLFSDESQDIRRNARISEGTEFGDPEGYDRADRYAKKAKDMHREKLSELKSMKPVGGMAEGGMCEHGSMDCHMCHGGKMMAEGGMMDAKESGYREMPMEHERMNEAAMREDDRMLNQHGMDEVGAMGMEQDNEPQHERMVEHDIPNQEDGYDMVDRIMKQRMEHYSEGGRVANDTPVTADFEDNQFDDLVKRDDLDSSYTGANSGDEIGDEQEDEDRRDIVSRIMKSRRLKDRMPNPM